MLRKLLTGSPANKTENSPAEQSGSGMVGRLQNLMRGLFRSTTDEIKKSTGISQSLDTSAVVADRLKTLVEERLKISSLDVHVEASGSHSATVRILTNTRSIGSICIEKTAKPVHSQNKGRSLTCTPSANMKNHEGVVRIVKTSLYEVDPSQMEPAIEIASNVQLELEDKLRTYKEVFVKVTPHSGENSHVDLEVLQGETPVFSVIFDWRANSGNAAGQLGYIIAGKNIRMGKTNMRDEVLKFMWQYPHYMLKNQAVSL